MKVVFGEVCLDYNIPAHLYSIPLLGYASWDGVCQAVFYSVRYDYEIRGRTPPKIEVPPLSREIWASPHPIRSLTFYLT